MFFLGRSFQVVGMLILLEALYFGIIQGSMGREMTFLVIGGAVFYLVRMIEARAH